ncbi:MAG: dTDP-4-amino-4,6-dideoxygalactose transaminase [Candidatus Aquicultorales bacterium]
MRVPFNKPYVTGKELEYVAQAYGSGHLSGDGQFTERCQAWLNQKIGCASSLLTHSCTGALEMAAMLADIKPGDEVIMPSFTFVSTANAFALRGAVPVFVDIRPDTLNIDESLIEAAITEKTKAIVPVHYAGVGCEMDTIIAIAEENGLLVIEDAAQGIMADYKGRPLGSIGHMAAFSFHETKNLSSGEGGALLINDWRYAERAEIIREKGTNRSQFFRGQVDKYTWVDLGSSYLPSEIVAAFLWAQMEMADYITERRLGIWNRYHESLAFLEDAGEFRRPVLPAECEHNGHIYYLILPNGGRRTEFIAQLKKKGIGTVFHYVPLHSAPAGKLNGRCHGTLPVTNDISDRLVRLPLWIGVEEHLDWVIDRIIESFVVKSIEVVFKGLSRDAAQGVSFIGSRDGRLRSIL